MPSDCELYVVDSQVDPEDFGHLLSFKDTNIYVAHAMGLHSLLRAPASYLETFHAALEKLDATHSLAYLGPFGGLNSSGAAAPACDPHSPLRFAQDFGNVKLCHLPRATCVNSGDAFLLRLLTPDANYRHHGTNRPAFNIWKTANSVSRPHLEVIMRSLCGNSLQFATFNSDLSVETRDLLFHAISRPAGRRCLIESDSTLMCYSSRRDLLPLSVVNTIVDLFVDFSRRESFKSLGLTLATFNTLFVENGFDCIPKARFTEFNTRHFARVSCTLLSGPYYKHEDLFSYGQSEVRSSTTAVVSALPTLITARTDAAPDAVPSPTPTAIINNDTCHAVATALNTTWSGPQQLWDFFTNLQASSPTGGLSQAVTGSAPSLHSTPLALVRTSTTLKRSAGLLRLSLHATDTRALSEIDDGPSPTYSDTVSSGMDTVSLQSSPEAAVITKQSFYKGRTAVAASRAILAPRTEAISNFSSSRVRGTLIDVETGHTTRMAFTGSHANKGSKRVRFADKENSDVYLPKHTRHATTGDHVSSYTSSPPGTQ